jgi:hypothetical protein
MTDGGDRHAPTPDFIDDESGMVGFLDLRDLDADGVTAILDGFSQLGDDAVLTVYCTQLGVELIAALSEPHGVELVHSVPHGAGTTFVLKRSSMIERPRTTG